MIELKGLNKKYGNIKAIDNLEFSVKKGEILGFLGPNGAGKTTTLRIITCFLRPTSGTVFVNGLNVLSHSLEVRKKIGYLPENSPLYSDMKVEEYLVYRMKLKKVMKRERKTQLDFILSKCALNSVRKQLIGELSKGYRQRVGFADAISHNPSILILDEPTQGMDPGQKIEIRNLIKELGQEHTVIFSTHILPEVELLCNRVVIIHKGHIQADSTTKKLRESASEETPILFEVDGPKDEVEKEIQKLPVQSVEYMVKRDSFLKYSVKAKEDSSLSVKDGLYEIVRSKNWKLRTLYQEEKTLEEIFIQITSS